MSGRLSVYPPHDKSHSTGYVVGMYIYVHQLSKTQFTPLPHAPNRTKRSGVMRSRPLRSSTLYQPLSQLQCNKPHHKSHSNHILMHTLHTAVHKHIRTHAYMSPLPHAPTCTSCNLIQNARDETPVCTCLHVYTYVHVHKLRQDPVLRSLRTCINLLTHWDRLCYQFAESDVNYTLIPSSREAQGYVCN